MTLTVQRAAERFVTRGDGWVGRYCFSYAEHYDASNVAFGPLLACNEFALAPGAGFDDHEHRAVEIVTWVVEGEVAHDGGQPLRPGQLQVLSSGTGVTHAELNPSATEPARFLQLWLASDAPGEPPRYAQADVSETLAGGLVPVVGEGAPVALRCKATLYAGRLARGAQVPLPTSPKVHLYVVAGRARLLDLLLTEGDEVRVEDEELVVTAEDDTELLVWALP